MTSRALIWLTVALVGLLLAAGQGCELVVGDGDYKVASSGSSSSTAATIGDLCFLDSECTFPATCASAPNTAGWCTRPCTTSGDCGSNTLGQKNYCLLNVGNANDCFPGCTGNLDCLAFTGTDCENATTTDQPTLNVRVCTIPASTDGGH